MHGERRRVAHEVSNLKMATDPNGDDLDTSQETGTLDKVCKGQGASKTFLKNVREMTQVF
jgi:hypothetical protein